MTAASDRAETAIALRQITGGRELLERLGEEPDFGDAEVVTLCLDRNGTSALQIMVVGRQTTWVTFHFDEWVDVSLRGFSRQNVVGGLKLRAVKERDVDPWEVGVGYIPGDYELELEPCFGGHGTIRSRIRKVTFELEPRPRVDR